MHRLPKPHPEATSAPVVAERAIASEIERDAPRTTRSYLQSGLACASCSSVAAVPLAMACGDDPDDPDVRHLLHGSFVTFGH
jgi:hypothetical protein